MTSGKKENCFLEIRSLVTKAARDFFHGLGYIEVETPVRCKSIIPEAHIDPVSSGDSFLHASPELAMKMILSGGHDKIFQICRCFRKGEKSRLHHPEMTMLEWYTKGDTYIDLMEQCESLAGFIAERLGRDGRIDYRGKSIVLDKGFEKLTVSNAFDLYAGTSLEKALREDRFNEILGFEIEPFLGSERPLFLCDYPAPMASLAKLIPQNPDFAQRFELYMAGIELANGFTELNDPLEQLKRFKQENKIRRSIGKSDIPIPQLFLNELGSMPDAAGIALGLDRLVMLFADVSCIDEVVAFVPGTI